MRTLVTAVLIITSLALLIPGVTQPVLTISGSIEKAQLVDSGVEMFIDSFSEGSQTRARDMLNMAAGMLGLSEISGQVEVFYKSRSIIDTVKELYASNNVIVAVLVGLFSIVVPAVKLSMMLLISLPMADKFNAGLYQLMAAIGKWSMADVFVVALIIVYMAGNASAGMGDMLVTTA